MSSTGPGKKYWRVFYAMPRAEKKAAKRLAEAGYEVFCPIRSLIRQWSDRTRVVEEPLFPGYLFAHVNERDRLDVLLDETIVRCVSFGGEVAAVSDREIDTLKLLQVTPDRIEVIERMASPVGAEVYIDRGPLKGVRGFVVDHPKAHYLEVDVSTIRQTVRVHIPSEWVRRPAGFHTDR